MQKLTYRKILLEEFDSRKSRRSDGNYSLRSFARFLDVPAPKLSQILRGKCGLSGEKAKIIASRLGLNLYETELFISLVESEHARSKTAKKIAHENVTKLLLRKEFKEIDLDKFSIIHDWYYFTILELSELKGISLTEDIIAEYLGLTVEKTKYAINKLLELGLLEKTKEGVLRQTKQDLATPSGIPSKKIRDHHAQILEKAKISLDETHINERDFSSIILSINSEDLAIAKHMLKRMRRRFAKRLDSNPNKNSVYCLSINFFPLTKTGGSKDESN